jgi:hypothetical protein
MPSDRRNVLATYLANGLQLICAEHYLVGNDPAPKIRLHIELQDYLRQLTESDYKA